MAESTQEKTEKPSFRKLKEARERGQIPRSRDLVVAIATLAVTLGLIRMGPGIIGRLGSRVAAGLMRIGDVPTATLTAEELTGLVLGDGWLLALAVGPLLLVGGIAGLAGNIVQSGFVIAPQALRFNWGRLSPAQGFARLAPRQSGVDFVKTMVAGVALLVISLQVGRETLAAAPQLSSLGPSDAARYGWAGALRLMWRAGFAMLAIAVADYGVQRWRHWTSLKMTKQETRDDAKGSDANPEVKARVRRIQRDMTRSRMLKAVKGATVVIANPTHYAVALEYRREKSAAPIVVAKGKDLLAARIRAIARDAGVPIVENVPLARALYSGTELGDAIPGPLFGAVAEVLAYLVRIKQLML